MKIRSLLASTVMTGALIGAVHAADSNLTVNTRKAIVPVGLSPQIGYVKATVVTPTAGVTVDMPAPRGRANILDAQVNVYSSAGAEKPAAITISTTTGVITVSGSVATSGSLAAGDVIKATIFYKP